MGDNFNGVDPLEFLLQPVQEEFANQLDFVDLQPVNLIEYITRAENELQNIVNTGGFFYFKYHIFTHPDQTTHTNYKLFMIRQKNL